MIELAWEVLKNVFGVIGLAFGFLLAGILGTVVFGALLGWVERVMRRVK